MFSKSQLSEGDELWNSCNWIAHLPQDAHKNHQSTQVYMYKQDTEALVVVVLVLVDMLDMVYMLEEEVVEVVEVQVVSQTLPKLI